jgi:hypothetical protein
MLFFLKLNNRHRGKMLTATSVQSCDDRKCGNNTETKHRQIQEPNPGQSVPSYVSAARAVSGTSRRVYGRPRRRRGVMTMT